MSHDYAPYNLLDDKREHDLTASIDVRADAVERFKPVQASGVAFVLEKVHAQDNDGYL